MSKFIFVLLCVKNEFGCETFETFVFTNEWDARIAKHMSEKNCDGTHYVHKHTVEF